jgi:uncharacterized protein YqgC (DUF456 family)
VSLTEVAVAITIAVGLVGILVPILPGTLLVLAAILVWAAEVGSPTAWGVAAAAGVLLAVGTVVKYALPGRHLAGSGIPASTQWIGALGAVIGFFVVPVVGILLGFVVGVYAAEHRRVGSRLAWPSTRTALRAVGLSILIELTAAVLAAMVWAAGVVAT